MKLNASSTDHRTVREGRPAGLRAASVLLAFALLGACAPPEIDRVDSPFNMNTDSMSFPNFAVGYDAALLDTVGVQRMFGDGVCEEGSDPCELTRPAGAFVAEANLAMGGGRCEGFAVLSILMSEGAMSPDDFGAPLARSLVLDDNPELQRELAYWFATQLIPAAVANKTQGYSARDVLPVLTAALAEDADERYRIGIVRVEGQLVTGGHSLTPVGFYRDENDPGVYWVRVYDNNKPDFERLLKVDIVNNRWEFEASTNPSQASRLYYGDESNQNVLWLAPILSRQGVQECHFCDGNSTTVESQGGARISVDLPGGSAGLTEEGFASVDGVSVTPSFSVALDDEPMAMQIALSPALSQGLANGVETRIMALPDATNPGARQRVHIAHDNMTTTATQLDVTDEDFFTATETGATYENNSRTGMNLRTQVVSGGKTLTVSVAVADGSDMVETQVDPESGAVTVDVQGADGAMVTIGLEAENDDGDTVSQDFAYVAGDDSTFAADTAAWSEGAGEVQATVSNDGAPAEDLTGGCFDIAQSGGETDIDCGGECERRCDVGQGCAVADDCAGALPDTIGFCNEADGLCVESACFDGELSGDETDVDCGGASCTGCVIGLACTVTSDCAGGGACVGLVCVETFAVGLSVTGLSLADTMVLQNNGADDLTIDADGSYTFPARVLNAFDVTISEQPETSTCTVTGGVGTATDDVVVSVSCEEVVQGFVIGGTLVGLEAGESVTLVLGTESLILNADGDWTFAGRIEGAYQVSIAMQPVGQNCTLSGGLGNATADVTGIAVQCCAAGVTGAGCSECFPGHGTAPPQCTVPACGDGILDPGEECDDADATDGDGCSQVCIIEAGYTCANAVQVNTGSDNAAGQTAVDTNDLIWSWSDTLGGARTPAVVSGNCAPGFWIDAAAYAEWVTPFGCGTQWPANTTHWYHVTFTLASAEAAAATVLLGTAWADDLVEDVFVNGVSSGVTSPAGSGFQGPGTSLSALPSNLYQAGENTISLAVRNLGAVPNGVGLLVQAPNAFGIGSVCTQ